MEIRKKFGLDDGKYKKFIKDGEETVTEGQFRILSKLRGRFDTFYYSKGKRLETGPITIKELKENEYISDEEKERLIDLENEIWNSDLIFKHDENSEGINFDTTKLSIISNIMDNIESRRKQDIEVKEEKKEKERYEIRRENAIRKAEQEVEKQFRSRELKARIILGECGDVNIYDIGISSEGINDTLWYAGVKTLNDLRNLRYVDLCNIHAIGKKKREVVISKLAEYGIRLEGQPELTTANYIVEEAETLEDVQKAKAEAMKEARDKAIKDFEKLNKEFNNCTPIEELDLSTRSRNSLTRAKIYTLEDLKQLSEEDLDKIRNLGRKSKEEVLFKIAEYDFTIKNETELATDEAEPGEKVEEIPAAKDYNEAEIEEDMYENLSLEELIEIAENSDPKSEQYIDIQKMLIQRVKAQQNIITEQQSTIDSLQSEVSDKRRNQHDEQ